MKEAAFEPISESKRKVIEKLLEPQFVGVEELRQQVPSLLVKQCDENGSIQLKAESSICSRVQDGPVAEARYPDANTNDTNGVCVNVLLHVKNGRLWMLEIYKDDSSRVLSQPEPNKLDSFSRLSH